MGIGRQSKVPLDSHYGWQDADGPEGWGGGRDLDAAATQLKRDELSLFDSRRQDRHLSERPYGSFWNEAIGLANKLCH